jgi:hypothetical protein
MDPRSLFAKVMAEAGRLGLVWWERLVLILAVALLLVMGREARDVLRNLKLEPQEPADEGGAMPPGQQFPTDPDRSDLNHGGG